MEITLQFIVLVPVVVGVVQAFKKIGMPSKWAAIAAIVFGVAGVSLLDTLSGANALQGIVVGLAAAGLYSGAKSTVS